MSPLDAFSLSSLFLLSSSSIRSRKSAFENRPRSLWENKRAFCLLLAASFLPTLTRPVEKVSSSCCRVSPQCCTLLPIICSSVENASGWKRRKGPKNFTATKKVLQSFACWLTTSNKSYFAHLQPQFRIDRSILRKPQFQSVDPIVSFLYLLLIGLTQERRKKSADGWMRRYKEKRPADRSAKQFSLFSLFYFRYWKK